MKKIHITLMFLFIHLFYWPNLAHADFTLPQYTPPTFENIQHLTTRFKIASSSIATSSPTNISVSIGSPVPITYEFSNTSTWPNPNLSPADETSAFGEVLKESRVFVSLWEGIPFSSTAHIVQSWEVSRTVSGQLTATFPKADSYFFVVTIPDSMYLDPQAECPNDPDWKIDCAPPYTLEQMWSYYTSSLTAPDPFPYSPIAFGGIRFNILTNNLPMPSSVLFLPGIEGSRLYMRNAFGIENTVWEPSAAFNLVNLILNTDGTSQKQIYTRDLVDYKYGIQKLGDVYGPFEKFMDGLVSQKIIAKWQAYPYDWRYDVQDIIQTGTLVGNPTGKITRVFLQDVVQSLASTSPSGKVTLIAHSNGGLLAKALAIELQKEHRVNVIDHIVLLASPQLGTPLSIGALLNGDGQTDATGGLIMYGGTTRTVTKTLPGMYGLLPSRTYISQGNIPIVFPGTTSTNLFTNVYGLAIKSFDDFVRFLTDSAKLTSHFSPIDLRAPTPLSSQLLIKANNTHVLLDSWQPPSSLKVSTIAGWGNPTPVQYSYSAWSTKNQTCALLPLLSKFCSSVFQANHTNSNSFDGDDTVLTRSATASSSDIYYFNAQAFASAHLGKIGHGNITSAIPIQLILQDMLKHKPITNPFISTTLPSTSIQPMLTATVGASANVTVTDSSGNQSGIFPVPGTVDVYYKKESIPGSSVQVLGDEKQVYLPEGQPYTISLQGYEPGLTSLSIGSMTARGVENPISEYTNIPTSVNMKSQLKLQPSPNFPSHVTTPLLLPVDITGLGTNILIQKSN